MSAKTSRIYRRQSGEEWVVLTLRKRWTLPWGRRLGVFVDSQKGRFSNLRWLRAERERRPAHVRRLERAFWRRVNYGCYAPGMYGRDRYLKASLDH